MLHQYRLILTKLTQICLHKNYSEHMLNECSLPVDVGDMLSITFV